jgi:hypothetical protein
LAIAGGVRSRTIAPRNSVRVAGCAAHALPKAAPRLLLSILDLRGEGQVTSHEVARQLIYPRLDIGRGAAWKSSPERRRTQRLIREAEALRRAATVPSWQARGGGDKNSAGF